MKAHSAGAAEKEIFILMIKILPLLVVFLCRPSLAQDLAWKGVIVEENGVKVVKNPAAPAFGDFRFELVEEWKIRRGPEESDFFSGYGCLAVGRDGRLYIADSRGRRVFVYDNGGRYLFTIGRPGQGPGEFEALTMIYLDAEGRLCGYGRGRLSRFDHEGKFVDSLTLRPFDVPAAPIGSNWLGIASAPGQPPRTDKLVIISRKGEVVKTLASFRMPDFERRIGQAFLGFYNPYLPRVLAVPMGPDQAVFGFSSEYRLSVLGKDGRTLYIIENAEKPEPYGREDRKMIIARESEGTGIPAAEVQKVYAFPDRKAMYYDLAADDAGWIYVHRTAYLKNVARDRIFDVYDHEGRFLRRAVLPAGIDPHFMRIKGDRLFGWLEDPGSGDLLVKRFRIANMDRLKRRS
jgi:hypothetical protein